MGYKEENAISASFICIGCKCGIVPIGILDCEMDSRDWIDRDKLGSCGCSLQLLSFAKIVCVSLQFVKFVMRNKNLSIFSLRTLQLLGSEKNGEFPRKTLEKFHLGKEIL